MIIAPLLFFFSHEAVERRNKQPSGCAFISVGGWQCILLIYSNLPALFCFAVQSQGAEIVNALALFLLLLLDLFIIGRQERLKCREVERRLQTIIEKINGEVLFICLLLAFVFSSCWILLRTWPEMLLIELSSLALWCTQTLRTVFYCLSCTIVILSYHVAMCFQSVCYQVGVCYVCALE